MYVKLHKTKNIADNATIGTKVGHIYIYTLYIQYKENSSKELTKQTVSSIYCIDLVKRLEVEGQPKSSLENTLNVNSVSKL